MDRFWSKVNKTEGCWEWTAGKTKDGYGIFKVHTKNLMRSHRYAWELECGPIPKGLCVLHKCDNRKCVNPNHLFLGTNEDNVKDREQKGRGVMPDQNGENNSMAKLTEEEIKNIRFRYENENITQKELGKIYNIDQSAVSIIINKKVWKKVG